MARTETQLKARHQEVLSIGFEYLDIDFNRNDYNLGILSARQIKQAIKAAYEAGRESSHDKEVSYTELINALKEMKTGHSMAREEMADAVIAKAEASR